jgi:hypothetical protein
LQYYEDQDQTYNRDGDNRINNGQHYEADECLVAKGNKSVISSMANRSIRLQIRVLGKPETCVDMVLAFSPDSII